MSFSVAGVAWKNLPLEDLMHRKTVKAKGQSAGLSLAPYCAAILKVGEEYPITKSGVWTSYN